MAILTFFTNCIQDREMKLSTPKPVQDFELAEHIVSRDIVKADLSVASNDTINMFITLI